MLRAIGFHHANVANELSLNPSGTKQLKADISGLTVVVSYFWQSLTSEVNRLRNSRHQADNQLQSLLLKVTEIQLKLATQDQTLNKLDAAVNGNGKPGLMTRVDRTERIISGLIKAVWLLTAAALTAAVRVVVERFN